MRTTFKERQQNARNFYSILRGGVCKEAPIVVERVKSNNPNISRCRFWVVPSSLGMMAPVVIAESVLGIQGCFIEFLGAIRPGPQVTYHEEGFNDWVKKNFGFKITYDNGLVLMLEKN